MITPKKELGQNFLKDPKTLVKMVDALDLPINKGVSIVEIGPGLGVLTAEILKRKHKEFKLFSIELDNRVLPRLKNQFEHFKEFELINENILDFLPKLNFEPELNAKILGGVDEFRITGSLPYYITSPILHVVIELNRLPDVCSFLVQKEVAQKIASVTPDANYLSTYIQTFFDVSYLGYVDRKFFDPIPKVDGGIIKLVKRAEILVPADLLKKYRGFLHKGFASPRKMLNKVFDKEFLQKMEIDPNLRPQNLDVSTWVRLFNAQL